MKYIFVSFNKHCLNDNIIQIYNELDSSLRWVSVVF